MDFSKPVASRKSSAIASVVGSTVVSVGVVSAAAAVSPFCCGPPVSQSFFPLESLASLTSSADTLESFAGDDLAVALTFDTFFPSEAVVEDVGLAVTPTADL